MRLLTAFILSLLVSLPVSAEPSGTRELPNGITVNFSVFNSTFLQPAVAMAEGLVRDEHIGIINIAPMQNGKGLQTSLIKGKVRNLLGLATDIGFHRIVEGESIYFIGSYPVETREIMTFEIQVVTPKGTHEFKFNQEMFPEKG